MIPYPLFFVYECVDEKWRVSLNERMAAWAFSGQAIILKAGYDAAWQISGGVVGSATYANALLWLGSVISEIDDGQGGILNVVMTPQPILVSLEEEWLQCSIEGCNCPLSPRGFNYKD